MAALLAPLGGCERIQTVARKVARPLASQPDYLVPPRPLSVARESGGVRISGDGPPDARVEFRSPDGEKAEANADAGGRWSVLLTAQPRPRLYAFEAVVGGRVVRAEGALCVMPGPVASVLVLRGGAGAVALGEASGLTVAAIDFDGGGGVAASGLALPNAPVRLSIDGAAAGLGRADGDGRYSVMGLDPRRSPVSGEHHIGVETPPDVQAEQEISLTAAPPLRSTEIYRASPVERGWRIDWRLPGGGLQTSIVFSPPLMGAGPNAGATAP